MHTRDYKRATHKGEKKFKGKVIKIKKVYCCKKILKIGKEFSNEYKVHEVFEKGSRDRILLITFCLK